MSESAALTLNDYQDRAAAFARFPDHARLLYPLLGLIGEVGELASKLIALRPNSGEPRTVVGDAVDLIMTVADYGGQAERLKKVIRDSSALSEDEESWALEFGMTAFERVVTEGGATGPIGKELSDVLWYVAKLAGALGMSLGAVGQANIDKLADRAARNAIGGSGDAR